MVAQRTLTPYVRVRILLPLPKRLASLMQVSFFVCSCVVRWIRKTLTYILIKRAAHEAAARRSSRVRILLPLPKQIPLLIQSCRQRYRYFTAKNIDRISTHKNKRCILGVFHPSCNAFLIVFIAHPRNLTQHSYRPIVKQPHFVKRLKSQMYHLICQWNVLNGYGK